MIALLVAALVQVDFGRLIRDLGSDDLEVRGRAQKALIEAGQDALPALEAAARDKDPELRGRAAAIVEEIRWGAANRALKLALRLANRDAFRTFEVRETTDAESRAWLPDCRFWTLECTSQSQDLSSLVAPRVFFARACEADLLQGAKGLDAAVRAAKIAIRSDDDAARFVRFMKRLQIPTRFAGEEEERGVLERTASGWTWTADYGRDKRVHRLDVDGEVLKGVGFQQVRK